MPGIEMIAMLLVMAVIVAMAEGRYKLGFILNLFAAALWGVIAVDSELWTLLGLQVFIAGYAMRGLYNLRPTPLPTEADLDEELRRIDEWCPHGFLNWDDCGVCCH